LDFRGHGRSARTPGKYLVRDYVHDAVAVLREHVPGPAVVYGHSLGALVGAAAAARAPDRVRGLVLEDPPFESLGPAINTTPFHSMFVAMRDASGSAKDVSELARDLAATKVIFPDKPEGVLLGELRDPTGLRFLAACLRHVDPALWDPVLAGRWLEGYDTSTLLRGIRAPTLLLQGEVPLGGMLSDAAAAEAAREIADCDLVRVGGVGHLIHTMRTEAALRLVGQFLASLDVS
jgi:pimeloyl-ACP methyl ester carboxylesterase